MEIASFNEYWMRTKKFALMEIMYVFLYIENNIKYVLHL